jgi:hypothetical protein
VFCTVRVSSAFFQFSHPLPVHSMKWMRETDGLENDIVDRQGQRFFGHAVDEQAVFSGIEIGHARVAALIMQVGRRDGAHQLALGGSWN